jgi:hypothetical protein
VSATLNHYISLKPLCRQPEALILSVYAAGSNQFTGTIPEVRASNLSRLQLLDVSNNRLTGALQNPVILSCLMV